MNWHEFYLNLCETIAKKSKDTSTKIGCVIIGDDHEIRSTGYNGFPRGVIDTEDDVRLYSLGFPKNQPNKEKIEEFKQRLERPLKYIFTEHAERNAIYNATRYGVTLKDCVLYVNNLPPCTQCTRAIIQCGIKQVYYYCDENNIRDKWAEEWYYSKIMLDESEVKYENLKKD